MRLKLITCEVFDREMTAVVARSPHVVETERLSKGLHNIAAGGMRERIQAAIDAVPAGFDAVLLGYGLCNNGLAGIEARAIPLVIPRAHDCITMLLGSKERYLEYFENHPGTYFKSSGWMEHETNPEDLNPLSIAHQHGMDASFESLVAKYGEENARYLWEELVQHTRHYELLAFIEMGVEPDDRFERLSREDALRRGWSFDKVRGDLGLLQRMVDGVWSVDEFQVVPPGGRLIARYDGTILGVERMFRVELQPQGRVVEVQPGGWLRDALVETGVEFPCGGNGRCRGCRVRLLKGEIEPTPDDRRLLGTKECDDGWRLACQAKVRGDLVLDLAQWESPVLADESVFEFRARDGWGVAVDVGTTTIAAQLLDLRSGRVAGVRTALNAQARHGADLMTRIEFAVHRGGQETLVQLLRGQIRDLVQELLAEAALPVDALGEVVLVGNSVMHHFFCRWGLETLAVQPFEPASSGMGEFTAGELGWFASGAGESRRSGEVLRVRFLPVLGGFVGSDLLAGILATRMHESGKLQVLIDLGTNGEIVVGNRERLLCASTAAGPAFEAARIRQGMRAATGAIVSVKIREPEKELVCQVFGNGVARGICGSGLVDAVACGLELGWIRTDGRLVEGTQMALCPTVSLQQSDIRELQLAKGAVAAGLETLLARWGAGVEDVERVWLAGAFGNYVNRASARRIGLVPFPLDRVAAVGNSALLGAKLALFRWPEAGGEYRDLRSRVAHVSLNEDSGFMDAFVDAMAFPDAVERGD